MEDKKMKWYEREAEVQLKNKIPIFFPKTGIWYGIGV